MAKYDNQAVPFWTPAQALTAHAGVALTGKRFVRVSGPRVGGNVQVNHSAGADVLGVAAYDSPAGDKVTVNAVGIVPVTAAAAITAGQRVTSDATGQAAVATGAAGATVAYAGIAVDDAAAGADVPVLIRPGAFVA